MSDAGQPRDRSRLYQILRGSLSIAGGAGYLCLMVIAAAFVATIWGGALGVTIFIAGAFITFRWFSQDDDHRRRRARLKRGASFACAFFGFAVFFMLMAFAFPPIGLIKPETMADITMVIAALAPLGFGIGAVTSK